MGTRILGRWFLSNPLDDVIKRIYDDAQTVGVDHTGGSKETPLYWRLINYFKNEGEREKKKKN